VKTDDRDRDKTGRRRALDDIYTFLVRGPSSRLPRGYVWLVPVWFAIACGLVVFAGRRISGRLPPWLEATELAGLLLACLTLISVLATVRRHAFRVSRNGIWLGCRTTRRRPRLRQVHIAWTDVAMMRMAATGYGVLLEIGLVPAARITQRPGPGRQVLLLLLGVLLMPLGFGRGRPALTAPRKDPPRYLIKVCDVTPAQLRQVLGAVKPPELAVRTLTKRSGMRSPAVPSPRPASASQPAGATAPH
jgi:hypothetical protein